MSRFPTGARTTAIAQSSKMQGRRDEENTHAIPYTSTVVYCHPCTYKC